MGRIFIFIGVIMMVLGFASPLLSIGGIFDSLSPMMSLATSADAREEALCEEGEHLEEEHGSSTYTQGSGYGRSTVSYCVDAEGNRRNVTDELVESMIGIEVDEDGNILTDTDSFMQTLMGGTIGNIMGQVGLTICLNFGGIILIIMGAFMMRGKRQPMMVMNPYNASFNPTQPSNSSGWGSPVQPNMSQNLTAQLQQLDQAYNQSLITQEEYDKARRKLLDAMK